MRTANNRRRNQAAPVGEPQARFAAANDLTSRDAEVRRIQAAASAFGSDISQTYDAFGENTGVEPSSGNVWAAFFGTPTAPWKTTSYDKYDRHNYNLPEAYVGENLRISQTIDELIYTDETYYTTELLPFNFTDQVSVAWDKWVFNEHFTGVVPEQGVSRLVSSTREARSESFIRHGLAAVFEHGFMATAQGRAHYYLTLAQIARAVSETTNFGVIYAYLTCHNYEKEWEAKHGYFKHETLKELLEREHFMWAITVKTEFGFEKLDAQIVEWMNVKRASADTWVIPPKPATYLRLVPAEKVYQYLAGDEGPNRVNEVVSAGRPHEANAPNKRTQDIVEPVGLFKKNKVFLTRAYHVTKEKPIDLMSRISSVGEYFKIVKGSASCDYRTGYEACFSDTRIFDEDNDCGYTVSKADGIRYSQVFDENGKPRVMSDNVNPADAADLDCVFFQRRILDPVTQMDKYVPIEFMGDIDPAFFGMNDVANLAYAAIARAFPDLQERKDVHRKLEAGMRLVRAMAMEPITANTLPGKVGTGGGQLTMEQLAGHTSWVALLDIKAGSAARFPDGVHSGIKDLVEAIQQVAMSIGSILSGSDNLFLNPKNALPIEGYGDATQERTLYENMLNFASVPVYQFEDVDSALGDVSEPATAETAGISEALDLLRKAFLDSTADGDKPVIAKRGLGAPQLAEIKAILNGNVAATMASYNALEQALLSHPEWSRASNPDKSPNLVELKTFVREIRELLGEAPAKFRSALNSAKGTDPSGTTISRRFKATYLAVPESNPSIQDGSARRAGFALASRFDISRPKDRFATEIVSSGAGAERVPMELVGASLENIPLMCALSGAKQNAVPVGEKYDLGTGFGGTNGYDANDMGLDQYYDAEPVGSMFPGTFDRAERAVRSVWRPTAGAQIGAEEVNTRFGTLGHNLDQLSKSSLHPLTKLVASVYFGTRWNLQSVVGMEENNVPAPCGILGFRVGMYDMAIGIKCRAGGDTGFTYFGNSRFMLADDAAIMIHYGHYTHYSKSVIHKPEQVFIAYDIFPNKCLGGMGVTPYVDRDMFNPADDMTQADIFYVMVPYTETNFPKVMSMAGRFYTYMDAGMLDQEDPANRALHYTTAPYYNRFWGWYSDQNVVQEIDEPMYRATHAPLRLEVWQGEQGTYNPASSKFDKDIIRNKSPWGVTTEGCRGLRNGQMDRRPEYTPGVLSL